MTLPADAQVSRDWSVCFAGPGTCTDVFLTTTPNVVPAGRAGTIVDLIVRHRELGAYVTALMDVSFFFDPVGAAARRRAA